MKNSTPFIFLIVLFPFCIFASIAWAGEAPGKAPATPQLKNHPPGMTPSMPPPEAMHRHRATFPRELPATYDVVDYLWEVSDYWWHEGDHERCVEINHIIIDLDPKFVEAYLTTAWLEWSLGRWEDAKKTLERCIAKNPKHYGGYYDLGWHHFRRKEYDIALPLLRKAAGLECPPDVPRMVPHTLEKMGRLDESLRAWEDLAKRYPKDLVVQHNLRSMREKIKNRAEPKTAV